MRLQIARELEAGARRPRPSEEYLPYYNEEVDLPQGTTFVKHFSVQDGAEVATSPQPLRRSSFQEK